jgi:iron complex outermembrane recepter protein
VGAASSNAPTADPSHDPENILNLDIDQLAKTPVVVPSMDIPVTSVTKEPSTVGRSAAAVFVITNEMIRRSGATCIPEALRMAPGLEVARVDAHTWAITARGFNSVYANKLLVLIDGRTVYTPVFSGVYWDVQDVLLEDVDRIEVIRGPGGTLWGSNAVNGVINVITKQAKDTQGAHVAVSGGSQERFSDAVRYGGQIGEDGYYRVYGKHFERGPGFDPSGSPEDSWRQGRFGFRADWNLDRSKTNFLTVQGDCYTGESGDTVNHTLTVPPYSWTQTGYTDNSGQNVLVRWRHVCDEDSDWALQTYFDNVVRGSLINSERIRTFDVDYQYRFPLGDRHKITCGAGYRHVGDECPSSDPFTSDVIPAAKTLDYASQFVQDEISLVEEQWGLIVGCKLEQDPYTGLEYQPTARLLWTPDRRHTLWGAVSRAVRTPSQVDRGYAATAFMAATPMPMFMRIQGTSSYQSEPLLAYEVGYRTQATDRFSYDVAAFYNVYDRLGTMTFGRPYMEYSPPPPHLILPGTFVNGPTADTYGVELSTTWSPYDHWRLSADYTFLQVLLHDPLQPGNGNSPHHQVGLRSSWDLRENVDFDLTLRYVDCIPVMDVPSYLTMDLRLAWRPRSDVEFAVVGQNLLQPYHYEFGRTVQNPDREITEVPRGVYGSVTWKR